MGEFATMGGDTSIPSTGSSTYENALGLTNPDSVLSGTSRGQQALGAPNIKTDSINQRIIVNDNTTNRVSFGKIGTGTNDWGLKVSKPTINVDTATNDQLIFNSAQNTLKIVKSGTITIPISTFSGAVNAYTSGPGGWPVSVSVAHGLGYTPIFIAYVDYTNFGPSGSYIPLPYSSNAGNSSTGYLQIRIEGAIDSVNFYAILNGFGYNIPGFTGGSLSIGPYPVKYYLLQETVVTT